MSSRKSRKKKHKKEPRISPSSSRDEKKARDTRSLSSLQSQHKHHRHERASCSSVKDEAKEKRSSDLPASTSKASSHTERSKTTDFRKSKEKRSPERKATGNSKTLSSPVREEKEKANFKRKHDSSSPRSSGKSSSRHTAARPLFSKELEEQRRKLVSRRSAPDEPIRRQDDLSPEELQEKRRKLMKRSSSGELHSDAKRRDIKDWTSSDLTHAIPRSEDLKEMRKKLVSGRPKEVDHQTIGRIKPKSEDKTISDHSKEVLPVVKCVNSGTKPKVPEDISHKQQHFTKKHAPGAIFGEEKPSSGSMPKISFKIPKKASNFKAQNTHIWKPVLGACDSRTQKIQPSHTDSAVAGSPSTNPPHISQQQEKRPPVVSSQTSNKPSSACLSSPLYLSNRVQQVQTNKTREVTTSSKTPSKAEHTPHPESTSDAGETFYSDQEMELVEELHLARSERRLEVNLVESCGELTCMDIDPPEDGASTILNKGQQLLIVLDTNVLLSHLDFVKKIRSLGLGALGFPTLLIPWVVLQELDFLKSGKLSSKVEDKARPAVHYIYSCLKNQEPRLMGQSMQQASQAVCGPGVMNNDDRVLQCCLQYQALYPGGALALCTNDKNLCSKALLSGVKALSKADLVKEVEGSRPTILDNLHTHPTVLPPAGPGEKAEQEGPDLRNQSNEVEDRELSECVSVLEACLQGALSEVLTEEMRAAYGDLWTEIVYVKPPWSLDGVLKCFRKHWIAVFGSIIKRGLLGSVEMLSDCLCSDRSVEHRSVQSAVRTSAELLSAFAGRSQYSGGVGQALSTLHMLQKKLQSPKAPAVCIDDEDSLMAEVEEDIAPPTHASHQEVWALFESIWNNVCQISSALFSAFHYTPGSTEPNLQPTSPPPQEAVSCLHWLSAALRQLLESLQRLLSVDGSIEDAQSLLSFIQASEIAAMEPRFTAGDLFDCVSQQEYREKLCVGGAQLSELSANLDRCAATLSSWP